MNQSPALLHSRLMPEAFLIHISCWGSTSFSRVVHAKSACIFCMNKSLVDTGDYSFWVSFSGNISFFERYHKPTPLVGPSPPSWALPWDFRQGGLTHHEGVTPRTLRVDHLRVDHLLRLSTGIYDLPIRQTSKGKHRSSPSFFAQSHLVHDVPETCGYGPKTGCLKDKYIFFEAQPTMKNTLNKNEPPRGALKSCCLLTWTAEAARDRMAWLVVATGAVDKELGLGSISSRHSPTNQTFMMPWQNNLKLLSNMLRAFGSFWIYSKMNCSFFVACRISRGLLKPGEWPSLWSIERGNKTDPFKHGGFCN